MTQRSSYGTIEVICGGMFSGKTEELVRRLKRASYARQKIQVFKPAIDTRYSEDHVESHDSNRFPSERIKEATEIFSKVQDNTRVVGIDEAQFFGNEVVDVAQKLAYQGKRVIVAGLDLDFRGKPFGPMPLLLAVSESITKLSAVCVVCGQPATRSQRLRSVESSTDQVLVGASESYEARCRICHEPDALAVPVQDMFPSSLRTQVDNSGVSKDQSVG